MKKIITAAVAAVLASTSLGVASAAEAQSRDSRARDDRREERQERREDRREWRQDRRDDRREYRQERRAEQRAYQRWQRAQRQYYAGRYVAPRGYAVRNWSYGQRMPSYYRTSSYVVNDYHRYGLQRPPYGHQYVRSGNDVVLTAVATGLITAVIAGLFQ
jgi:Ni/Co efflux regulator RcnB